MQYVDGDADGQLEETAELRDMRTIATATLLRTIHNNNGNFRIIGELTSIDSLVCFWISINCLSLAVMGL